MLVTNLIARTVATFLLAGWIVFSAPQAPTLRAVDLKVLREYVGVYRWEPNAFLYLQMWDEFSGFGDPQLVAFDESGEVRTLYPTGSDQFFAGPGAAVRTSIESRVEFQRDGADKITLLTWRREGAPVRLARRVEIEEREDIRFASGDLQLAGTFISPKQGRRHSAIVLVHGSGAENREYMLPWAHFLIRHGIAVLGYDKRGVGGSTGDWNTASFEDLAGDVIAAVDYLKTRNDVDPTQIGLMGISQAGWVMPLAAIRSKDIAFLISISGAGVPPAETTIDQARNEMTMTGMPRQSVETIIALLKLQYEFARTGEGWEAYTAAREKIVARLGKAPDTFPGTPDHPYWQFIKRLYFYDPGPVLRQLKTPTLALWGELDNNVLAEKNKAAWEVALKAAGNRDFVLRILPKANHIQFEAKIGSNAETPTLHRFAPAFFPTVQDWFAIRVRGFRASR